MSPVQSVTDVPVHSAVRTQLAHPQIVDEEVNDIRLFGLRLSCDRPGCEEEKEYL